MKIKLLASACFIAVNLIVGLFIFPVSHEDIFKEGLSLLKEKQTNEAYNKFQEAYSVNPDFPPAIYYLVKINNSKNDFNKSILLLDQYFQKTNEYKGKDHDKLYEVFAESCFQSGQEEKALQICQNACHYNKTNFSVFREYSQFLLAKSNFFEAKSMLNYIHWAADFFNNLSLRSICAYDIKAITLKEIKMTESPAEKYLRADRETIYIFDTIEIKHDYMYLDPFHQITSDTGLVPGFNDDLAKDILDNNDYIVFIESGYPKYLFEIKVIDLAPLKKIIPDFDYKQFFFYQEKNIDFLKNDGFRKSMIDGINIYYYDAEFRNEKDGYDEKLQYYIFEKNNILVAIISTMETGIFDNYIDFFSELKKQLKL